MSWSRVAASSARWTDPAMRAKLDGTDAPQEGQDGAVPSSPSLKREGWGEFVRFGVSGNKPPIPPGLSHMSQEFE